MPRIWRLRYLVISRKNIHHNSASIFLPASSALKLGCPSTSNTKQAPTHQRAHDSNSYTGVQSECFGGWRRCARERLAHGAARNGLARSTKPAPHKFLPHRRLRVESISPVSGSLPNPTHTTPPGAPQLLCPCMQNSCHEMPGSSYKGSRRASRVDAARVARVVRVCSQICRILIRLFFGN